MEDVAVLVLQAGPSGETRDNLAQVRVLGNAVLEFAVIEVLVAVKRELRNLA
jgi:hypothetical protein